MTWASIRSDAGFHWYEEGSRNLLQEDNNLETPTKKTFEQAIMWVVHPESPLLLEGFCTFSSDREHRVDDKDQLPEFYILADDNMLPNKKRDRGAGDVDISTANEKRERSVDGKVCTIAWTVMGKGGFLLERSNHKVLCVRGVAPAMVQCVRV